MLGGQTSLIPAAGSSWRHRRGVRARDLLDYALESVSRTFHGRDLFAGRSTSGGAACYLWPLDPDALARLDIPQPERARGASHLHRALDRASRAGRTSSVRISTRRWSCRVPESSCKSGLSVLRGRCAYLLTRGPARGSSRGRGQMAATRRLMFGISEGQADSGVDRRLWIVASSARFGASPTNAVPRSPRLWRVFRPFLAMARGIRGIVDAGRAADHLRRSSARLLRSQPARRAPRPRHGTVRARSHNRPSLSEAANVIGTDVGMEMLAAGGPEHACGAIGIACGLALRQIRRLYPMQTVFGSVAHANMIPFFDEVARVSRRAAEGLFALRRDEHRSTSRKTASRRAFEAWIHGYALFPAGEGTALSAGRPNARKLERTRSFAARYHGSGWPSFAPRASSARQWPEGSRGLVQLRPSWRPRPDRRSRARRPRSRHTDRCGDSLREPDGILARSAIAVAATRSRP